MKESNQVTTIQLTSKHLKLHKMISWVFILLGILLIVSNSGGNEGNIAIGALCSLFGFVLLGITRFRIWWNHK